MNPLVIEVTRGEQVESLHRVHVVACSGRASAPPTVAFSAGDPDYVSFVRSAIKMFQAMPLVEDGGVESFGLTAAETALTCASHSGEPIHVEAARSILAKADLDEHALACGPHEPMNAAAAAALLRTGQPAGRIHNNCSGKHAGMLALARLHAWPTAGYHERSHPVQRRMLDTLAGWADVSIDRIAFAVDGCGLPTFALPLRNVASACARFAFSAADARGDAAARLVRAIATHPEYIAGTGRLCSDLTRVTDGRVFAKVGAEGYYCAAIPSEGLGVALKVEDGAKRAAETALLWTLDELGLLNDDEIDGLQAYATPAVLNTRGERVGEIRVKYVRNFTLE